MAHVYPLGCRDHGTLTRERASMRQALAVGTPVVTLPSSLLGGRLTLALYQRLGVLDCVAKDAHDYVAIALKVGPRRVPSQPTPTPCTLEKLDRRQSACFSYGSTRGSSFSTLLAVPSANQLAYNKEARRKLSERILSRTHLLFHDQKAIKQWVKFLEEKLRPGGSSGRQGGGVLQKTT